MNYLVLKRSLFFVIGLFASTTVLAQNVNAVQDSNGITVIEDKRIPKLVDEYIGTLETGVPGSRVQIFFTAKKNQALETKTTFMETFPDYVVIVDYDPPNFKVLAGAFRTKLQAEKLLKLVRDKFPGSFIVKDNIPIAELNYKD